MAIFEKDWFKGILVIIFFFMAIGIHISLKTYEITINDLERDKFEVESVQNDLVDVKDALVEQGAIEEPNDEAELYNQLKGLIANSHTPFLNVCKFLAASIVYAMPIAIASSFFGIIGGFFSSIFCIVALYWLNSDPTNAFDIYPEVLSTYMHQAFLFMFLTGFFAGLFSWLTNKTLSNKLELIQIDHGKLTDRHAMVTTSQEQLQKQVGQLSEKQTKISQSQITLYEISRQLGSALDLESTMRNVLAGISKLLDAPDVELLKLEKGFDMLRVADFQGHESDGNKMRQVQIKVGEGMIGSCAEMKKLISKADVKKDFSMGNLTQHPLLPTEVVIPLVQGDDLIGVINVSKVNKVPEQDEIRLLYVISQLAAMAIKNANFYMKIKELAEIDALTKMFNNRFFKEFVDKECERSQQYGDQFTLLLADIDHFKGFNDTFGHQVGDLVLAETASEFIKIARPDIDIAARYGGEEFCLVLPKMGMEEGRQTADRLRQNIADRSFKLTPDLMEADKVQEAIKTPPGNAEDGKPIMIMDPDNIPLLHVTVSIGVATYPVHATNRDFMVKKSDEALYVAKESGRNQVQLAK